MKKRHLSLFLAAVLIFGALPAISLPASAAADMTTFTEVYDITLPAKTASTNDTDGDGYWDRWNNLFDVAADGKSMNIDSSTMSGVGLCALRQLEAVDHSRDMYLKQKIYVEALPTSAGGVTTDTDNTNVSVGYYGWFCDGAYDDNAKKGMTFGLYNDASTGLTVQIPSYTSGAKVSAVTNITTGKQVGDTFELGIFWGKRNTVEVYIDGTLKGTVANATWAHTAGNGAGYDCLDLRFQPGNLSGQAKLTVSDVSISLPKKVEPGSGLLPDFTNIVLQLGKNQSMMNFTWFGLDEGTGTITYAKKSDMVNGEFPANAATVTATRTASVKEYYFGNKATITGLVMDTEYCYQLKNGNSKSEIYSFTTGKGGDSFSFAVVADAQIGAGQLGIDRNQTEWARTLNQLVNADEFKSADFMLSVGDQINQLEYDYALHEEQFDAYANHDVLLSIPTVVTLGNHDNYAQAIFPYHFNIPNLDENYGATYDTNGSLISADYYFVYNKVLFIFINDNDFKDYDGNESSIAKDKAKAEKHGEFIEKVMEETKNLDIDWKIAVQHRSVYGSSYHGNYTTNGSGTYNRTEQYNYVNMRKYLEPYYYENGIDLVLSGHDHCYTRTHVIKPAVDGQGNYMDRSVITPYEDENYVYADGSTTPKFKTWTDDTGKVHDDLKVSSKPVAVYNPDGVVHITGATASGSQVNATDAENLYTAVQAAANTRQMMRIDITEDSLKIVNYNLGTGSNDNINVIDEFTIYRDDMPSGGPQPGDTPGGSTDTDAPVVSGVTSGKTYYTTQTVTVSDKNLESVTLNGKAVTGQITIPGNVDKNYTIIALDKAGNATTVAITMKSYDALIKSIERLSPENVAESDRAAVTAVKNQVPEILTQGGGTQEEKNALNTALQQAEQLLAKLDSANPGNPGTSEPDPSEPQPSEPSEPESTQPQGGEGHNADDSDGLVWIIIVAVVVVAGGAAAATVLFLKKKK